MYVALRQPLHTLYVKDICMLKDICMIKDICV